MFIWDADAIAESSGTKQKRTWVNEHSRRPQTRLPPSRMTSPNGLRVLRLRRSIGQGNPGICATMLELAVNTIQSGEEEADYLYVSLHFKSSYSANDCLHVVCGRSVDERERQSGMDKIDLERLDQTQAGYGAASRILVTAEAIQFDFTPDGQRLLGFSSPLRLLWSSSSGEYREAHENLAKMQTLECGKAIEFG